jgi:hypothetical protein
MHIATRLYAAVFVAAFPLVLDASDGPPVAISTAAARPYDVWQNPFLSPDPGNNVHDDSYLSDSYPYAGPVGGKATVTQVNEIDIDGRKLPLGECAGQAFDADGNIQSVCAGVAGPSADSVQRYVVTLDRDSMRALACYPFDKPLEKTGKVDFGGAGYFYQDNDFRMVVAMPNGHVLVLRRVPSSTDCTRGYIADADYNLTGPGGSIPIPPGLASLDLYALVPDKAGNIWFTTAQGVVGTIDPKGKTHWIDLNDPTGTGQRQPQPDKGYEAIANSHAVDEGDTASDPSGVYVVTTYRLYRLSTAATGNPKIDWSTTYDRGYGTKSGQVSPGSGTSPTVFRMGGRRFVTIADNAVYMNVNVYRAEATLGAGESRLFAQTTPFGKNDKVSDENSLIVASGADGKSVDIYAENNYGNDTVSSTLGKAVTVPGFARMHLQSDGSFAIASVNNTIAVPSLVSKMSAFTDIVYTYNKTQDGWYLTGLDANDLNKVRFSVFVGGGTPAYNNFYAALSLDRDGRKVWIGTLFGLTRVEFAQE